MAEYRIVTFVGPDKEPIPGICVGERVVGLAEACKGKSVKFSTESNVKMLQNWDAAEPVLEQIGDELERDKVKSQALSSTKLKAPLLYPNVIYNAAANYPGHRAEMGNPAITPEIKAKMKPYMFLKSPIHCTIGPGEEIKLPTTDVSECVDWEAELGVVIGRKGLKRTLKDARAIVAGYTIFNDLSIRDRNRQDWPQFRTDWFTAKTFETSAPHGPWIVPAKQNPRSLQVQDRPLRRQPARAGLDRGRHDLQHRGSDRIHLRAHDHAARRPDRDRHHAGRRQGRRQEPLSAARQHCAHRYRRHRHAREQVRRLALTAPPSLTLPHKGGGNAP